jgi:SOS-response transcriptional repressor LexA
MELSQRQKEVLDYIEAYRRQRDLSPTFREIADGVGLSLTTVMAHIQALRDKGCITWEPNSPRSIHIIRQKTN